jgi:DNA-binding NarL/FixJ family response regulator
MSGAWNSSRQDSSDAADTGGDRRPAPKPRIRIGVVESDTLLREGLVALLNTAEEFDCIGAWSQSQQALTALQGLGLDVLLLDIRLLRPSGLELLRRLPAFRPAIRVLVTMNCPEERRETANLQLLPPQRVALALLPEPGGLGEDSLLEALQHGTYGIVCKEHGFEGITQAIHKVYAGERFVDSATVTRLAESYLFSLQLDATTEADRAESLTLRERQVIRLIGQGYSNKDIAREMQLSYSTVKNYVSSILKKLRLDGRTQIALYARYNPPFRGCA